MEKYKKASLISFFVYLVFIVFLSFFEHNLYSSSNSLIWSKYIFISTGVGLLWWIYRYPWSYFANMFVGIHFVLFCAVGQLQSPFYFLYFQILMIAYSFLFPVERRLFKAVLILGSLLFCLSFLSSYDTTILELQKPRAKNLFIISIFSSVVLSYLSHTFFTSDRTIRNDLLRRFSIVGLQAAQVVHDVKNALFPSLLTVESLKIKANQAGHSDLAEQCEVLQEQLDNFKSIIESLNRMSAVQTNVVSNIFLAEVIADLKQAMSSQLRNVDMAVKGNALITTEEASLKAVFFNLIQNSLDQFRRGRIQSPQIVWDFSTTGTVVYKDNGGGFSEDKLRELNRDQYDTGHGSALGLFVVTQTLSRISAGVQFANSENGVKITVKFKS